MRCGWILAASMVFPALARGACGPASTLRDWGLHREWQITCDAGHPERPARLIEVPWSMPAASCRSKPNGNPAALSAPEVRSGMRVTLWRRQESTDLHLSGIALGTARRGERVKVRAGLGTAVLNGIVRGPALVELTPEEERR